MVLALLVVVAYAAYRWWKNFESSRGSLEFDLPSRRHQPNDVIQGALHVQADKKDLGPGRLFVSLVCEQLWQERRRNDDGPDHGTTRRRSST